MPQSAPIEDTQRDQKTGWTILVAEDDPVIRRFLRIILKGAGFGLIEACNGEEAIRLTAGNESAIDLIITDGVMPGMDGVQLARYFLERIPHTKAILISGYLEHFLSRSDMPSNLEGFFRKPFTRQELLQKVGELLPVR